MDTYSSSVGHCRCSRQCNSMPCPRCKSSNSSTRSASAALRTRTSQLTIDILYPLWRNYVKHVLVSQEVDIVCRIDCYRHAVYLMSDYLNISICTPICHVGTHLVCHAAGENCLQHRPFYIAASYQLRSLGIAMSCSHTAD